MLITSPIFSYNISIIPLIVDSTIRNLPCTLKIFFIKTIVYPIPVGYLPYYYAISL